ncbi:MAG: acetate--CoA ligase [Nitrosopumilus sp.]|nr:acetate--CoA ligase [Nitrosopumilus sp.]
MANGSKLENNDNTNNISLEGKKIKKIKNKAADNPDQFWSECAKNLVWFKQWDKTVDWNPPFAKWFQGGKINAAHNCLDKHIESEIKNKAAIIWEGENGESTTLTYNQVYCKVNQLANALKKLGIKKGDRVTIYLPMIPELPISMLACARIGAIHSVVFSGFSSQSIADRANDSKSRIIITADGGYRRGKTIPLKDITDDAVKKSPHVEKVIVVRRTNKEIAMGEGDLWFEDIINQESNLCESEWMDSSDPLFILYTSGTTGKPKGVVHGTGGYLTHLYNSAKWVFNFVATDIFFCTADIGWVTGHSYVVYAPLMHGVTEIMYEGAPDFPDQGRYWDIVEKYGATILYTTPTALRAYMRHGDDIPNSFNLSTLRLLGTVGEPINPEVWLWYYNVIGKQNCPIVDTWWQTETGGIMVSMCSGIENIKMKPGSGTFSLPGIEIEIVGEGGEKVESGKKGYLTIKKPWPGMLLSLWNDDERYKKTYWEKAPNRYFAGDFAYVDKDGYIWILGRSDDILKVSGHRLGTIEIESAFVSHQSVAEAAVTSKNDEIKGETIIAFLVLKSGFVSSEQLNREMNEHIRNTIGPIAVAEKIYFVNKLPKTRSGKIMRRLLRSIVNKETIGDITTLEDEASVEEIIHEINQIKKYI